MDRVESFYNVTSRRHAHTPPLSHSTMTSSHDASFAEGRMRTTTTTAHIHNGPRFGPTDLSPVRWRGREDGRAPSPSKAAPNDEARQGPSQDIGGSAAHSRGSTESAALCSSSPHLVGLRGSAGRPMIEHMRPKAVASLPLGWRPASVEFDNVVQHRLWLLEDKCNSSEVVSAKHVVGPNPHGASLLVGRDGDRANSPIPLTTGVPPSGDPLVRVYQVRASMQKQQQQRPATGVSASTLPIPRSSSFSGLSTTASSSSAALPSSFTIGAGILGPRPSSTVGVTSPQRAHHVPGSRTATTGDAALQRFAASTPSNMQMMSSMTAAQQRIASAAARIAAVATELGSASVDQSSGLQRLLRQKKQEEEDAAIAILSDRRAAADIAAGAAAQAAAAPQRKGVRQRNNSREVSPAAEKERTDSRVQGSVSPQSTSMSSNSFAFSSPPDGTSLAMMGTYGKLTDSFGGFTLRSSDGGIGGRGDSHRSPPADIALSVSTTGAAAPSLLIDGATAHQQRLVKNNSSRLAFSSNNGGVRTSPDSFASALLLAQPPSQLTRRSTAVTFAHDEADTIPTPQMATRGDDDDDDDDDDNADDRVRLPSSDEFPFTHILSSEEVLLLAELAGTDGIMGETTITGDMWAFEHHHIRAAAKEGLLEEALQQAAAAGGKKSSSQQRTHAEQQRRRSSAPRPSQTFLGDTFTMSSSSKLIPSAASRRRRSSTSGQGDHDDDVDGGGANLSHLDSAVPLHLRESKILEKKLRALERHAATFAMPQISLEAFDVGSPTFQERLRRKSSATADGFNSTTSTSAALGTPGTGVATSPLSDQHETPTSTIDANKNADDVADAGSPTSSSDGAAKHQRVSKIVLFDAKTANASSNVVTTTEADNKQTTTLERRIAGGGSTGLLSSPPYKALTSPHIGGAMVISTAAESPKKGANNSNIMQVVVGPGAQGGSAFIRTTPRTQSIVDFFGKKAKTVVAEGDTFIPSNELHLYQLYCLNTNMVLIFRPVSPSVPPMYAGNFFVPPQFCDEDGIPLMINEINQRLTLQEVLGFTVAECRVKGKGIGVSLKSSPYPPIDGFIPINPSLSKTYSEARKKERALEDNLINQAAGGGDAMSTALLRKMRSQKSLFSAATSVAMKEIEASLKDSDQRLAALLDAYRRQSSYAIDKLAVAEEYIGVLNETQFLGKTIATWRGMQVYYKQLAGDADVERRENAHPIFYCLKGSELFTYDLERNELELSRSYPATAATMDVVYHPVYILTHRSFVISSISKRIEPDPLGDFLIGPDFDGFAYAANIVTDKTSTVDAYRGFADEQIMNLRVLPTMGLVNDIDIDHILEMRRLTEWKQSHGYECSNTLKTQDISDGPHVIVMPNEVRLANNFPELMTFYREAWQCGYPLLLNPNWRVVLCPTERLPVTLGDELSLPIIDDCGLALLKHHLSSVGKKFDDLKDDAVKYIEELVSLRRQGVTRLRVAGMYSTSLIPRVAIVVARKKLADYFYKLRRWMLFPPLFLADKLNTFEDDGSTSPHMDGGLHGAAGGSSRALTRKTSSVFTSGRGGKKAATVPVNAAFEAYREQRVAELRAVFDEECAIFEALFSTDDPRFVRRLKHFIDPAVAAQASLDANSGGKREDRDGAEGAASLLNPTEIEDTSKSSDRGAGLSSVLAAVGGGVGAPGSTAATVGAARPSLTVGGGPPLRRSSGGAMPTTKTFLVSVAADGERPFAA